MKRIVMSTSSLREEKNVCIIALNGFNVRIWYLNKTVCREEIHKNGFGIFI